jgi:hypothetical protein
MCSKARRAPPSAADSWACRRWDGRRSCRSWRRARRIASLGAPDLAAARAAADEEVAFAASLCDHPKDTLVAVRRTFEDGAIREAFRTLRPRGTRKPMRAFSFLEVEGEEEVGETIDLVNLGREKQRDQQS